MKILLENLQYSVRGTSIPSCNVPLNFKNPIRGEIWTVCGYGAGTSPDRNMTIGPGCINAFVTFSIVTKPRQLPLNSLPTWILSSDSASLVPGDSGALFLDSNSVGRGVAVGGRGFEMGAVVPTNDFMNQLKAQFPWANLTTDGNDAPVDSFDDAF